MRRRWMIITLLGLGTIVSAQQTFYVLPQGSDRSNGSVQTPWRTFHQAIKGLRAYRATHPNQAVEVLFADGVYYVDKTIRFEAQDSGSPEAPISYKAMENARPIFTGSIPLQSWKPVKDKQLLSRLMEQRQNTLYVCHLPKHFNSNSVPVKAGERVPLNDSWQWIDGSRTDLVCNDEFQTLARYPNRGFLSVGRVLSQPDEKHPEAVVRFTCSDERFTHWKEETDVYWGGYWKWDWSDEYQHVAQISLLDSSLRLSKPYHARGYKTNAPFWGLNLFCELDSVSEYYINRNARKIYWIPKTDINLKTARIGFNNFTESYHNCSYLCTSSVKLRP